MATETLEGVLRYIRYVTSTKECDQQSDNELLQQFAAKRDEGAFAALLHRHARLVFGVCRQVLRDPHAAEDAFQATFLVLARKATSIRKQDSLAAWLYRVAINISRTAKSNSAQQRFHEKQAVAMTHADTFDEVALRDWQPVIHEEVDQLPEKYRVPIVLCYLEGKSHDEVARLLDWPLGTVKGRLARARDMLRTRLTRRGLVLSAGAVASALTQSAAMGHAPTAVLGHTLKAALTFAGEGTMAAGIVSPQALALAKGALRTMAATKLASTLVVMLAVGVFGLAIGVIAIAVGPGTGNGRDAKPNVDEVEKKHSAAPLRDKAAVDFGPEVKGLQAKITLDREKFQVNEAIEPTYVLRNVSKEAQVVWHSGFWPNHEILVKDAGGKEPPLTEFGQQCRQAFTPGGGRDKNVPVKVPPGGEDAAYEKYNLTKLYDLSKPGRYTVQYVYEEKQGGWEGRLLSNEAVFEVVLVKADPKNAIEKDSVHFEILVPDRAWTIPQKPDGKTAVRLALRITNNTEHPFRFSRFDTLNPEMVGPDKKALQRSGGRDSTRPAKESDFPLAKPGESVTFDIDAQLSWQGDKLRFGGADGFGGTWGFAESFGPGRYQLRIWYVNQRDKAAWPGTVWTGEVKTPFVEVSLASPVAALAPTVTVIADPAEVARMKMFYPHGFNFVDALRLDGKIVWASKIVRGDKVEAKQWEFATVEEFQKALLKEAIGKNASFEVHLRPVGPALQPAAGRAQQILDFLKENGYTKAGRVSN